MTSLEMPAIFPVASHTDKVGPGTTFVVIKGLSKDGLEYVPLALEKGATCIVVEHTVVLSDELKQLCQFYNARIEYVENARKALAQLSAQAAGYPARSLSLYAVTGTKGKTTSVWMLYHIMCKLNCKVALMSTVGNYIYDTKFDAGMTTPQPDYIHQFLKLCVENGITQVVMEVAAQATTFFRLETLQFSGLVFTNLEREHGELYSTLDDYFQAKCNIVDFLSPKGTIIVNSDNEYGKKLYNLYPAFTQGYSFDPANLLSSYTCSYKAENNKICITINNKQYTYSQFYGLFNAYNLAAVIIFCTLQLKISSSDIQNVLPFIPCVPGRMETYVLYNGATFIIDYAHTPSSFEALFSTLAAYNKKLIIIFGAGGGKDTTKRPLMGAIAASYGYKVYITNDNPRFDNPHDIAYQIMAGIPEVQRRKVRIELDRKQAIESAIQESDENTLILALGKGPDEYQLIQGQKLFFSERLIALQYQ